MYTMNDFIGCPPRGPARAVGINVAEAAVKEYPGLDFYQRRRGLC